MIEVRTSRQNEAACGGCGARVRWCTDIATDRRVALNADAVAWSTRFDRFVFESVERYEADDVHSCRRPR